MESSLLQPIADDVWHVVHTFSSYGLKISSRMTVIRLPGNRLWLHSPVPIGAALHAELLTLGEVSWIIAPNKLHHLFLSPCAALFPAAAVFTAPGLSAKRPDLAKYTALGNNLPGSWHPELDYFVFGGIPMGNETIWFHHPSGTLVLTDLCQWWQGELPFLAQLYALLTGVGKRMVVPPIVRWSVRDAAAARASADQMLQWPIRRVMMAHNTILEQDAYPALQQALRCFG